MAGWGRTRLVCWALDAYGEARAGSQAEVLVALGAGSWTEQTLARAHGRVDALDLSRNNEGARAGQAIVLVGAGLREDTPHRADRLIHDLAGGDHATVMDGVEEVTSGAIG